MSVRSRLVLGWLVAAAGAACSGGGDGTDPALPPCALSHAFSVSLAVGQYVSIDARQDSGCVAFAANGGGSDAEYLVIPQSASDTPGVTTSFRLAGDTARPVLAASVVGAGEPRGPADAFHIFLREAERTRMWGAGAAAAAPAFRLAAPPPVVGHQRNFSVCSNTSCSAFRQVTAVAEAVGSRIAIYVDTAAPANGLNSFDLDTLVTLFDTRLYAADTAAFGRESDVDTNSVVIVLMTNVVNQLVTSTQCTTSGFVAGFFFGADIDPTVAGDPRFNRAEVFYSLVADSAGDLSCAHTRDQVKRIVPVTFAHEFQHMISYNQHVLVRNGPSEILWLNEALSHYAEEVAGRTFLPGDNASFSRFVLGNLFNAYSYLDTTGSHFLVPTSGIGSLAERGAQWLFLRYLVDQFAADTTTAARNAFTRGMVQTNLIGGANVVARTGQPFAQSVTRWALANWVSDLVVTGFTPPPELQYTSWAFRATYASLNAQAPQFFPKPFPLVPTQSAGDAVDLSGTLRAGSGVYHRIIQPAGADGFTLLFSDGAGNQLGSRPVPRLSVIRIR